MNKNTTQIKIEEDEQYSNDDLFNISSWGADLSFRELVSQYNDGDIEKPELQRNYVWTKLEASRFIESILLGLPIPSIFLANTENNKRLIIDGYQRIMSVYDYIEKKVFSGDNSAFSLSNSPRINIRWRNKTFDQLSEDDKRRIKTSTIHCIIFEQKHPKDDTSLNQIFERINTGGRNLNAQEIRNCVSQGSFNLQLFKMNKNKTWRLLYGKENSDNRMLDIELILRFYAMLDFFQTQPTEKQINLRFFLDKYMKSHRNDTVNESKFIHTMDFIYNNIGKYAFNNYNFNKNNNIKKVHAPIFDAISVATAICIADTHDVSSNLEKKRLELLSNEEFKLSTSTTDVNNINKRIKLAAKYFYNKDI